MSSLKGDEGAGRIWLLGRYSDVFPVRADDIPAKVLDQLLGRARRGVRRDACLPGEPAQQRLGCAKAGAELAQVQVAVALGKAAAVR